MKKIFFITSLLVSSLLSTRAYSQGVPVYPIPSYNVSVNGYANFREDYYSQHPNLTEGKREMNVQIKSGTQDCQATVWVYSLDRTIILGPYDANCDNIVQVEIDDREWGVLVYSESTISVDVYIDSGEQLPLPIGINPKKTF